MQRLFLRHTGMTFGRWRQQARLLAAMERLARGERVLDVALDLGYESERLRGHVPQGLGEPPSLRGARGRPPEGCGTGAGIRAQAGANLA